MLSYAQILEPHLIRARTETKSTHRKEEQQVATTQSIRKERLQKRDDTGKKYVLWKSAGKKITPPGKK